MSENTGATPRDYEVGYGKPPRKSQFKPGQSGNPKGRPKGSKSLAAHVCAALNEKVIVTQNGRQRSISKGEAIVTQLVNKSAAANMPALRLLIPLMQAIDVHPPQAEADMAKDQPPLAEADELVLRNLARRLGHPKEPDGA